MNSPPRFFAAPPPLRRRLSWRLALVLLALWAVGTAAAYRLAQPLWVFRALLLVMALAWAWHVVSVLRHNARV